MNRAVDEPVWVKVPMCDDLPVGAPIGTEHLRDGTAPVPTIQETQSLLIDPATAKLADRDMPDCNIGVLKEFVNRLESSIDRASTQLEKTLTKHHEELLWKFRSVEERIQSPVSNQKHKGKVGDGTFTYSRISSGPEKCRKTGMDNKASDASNDGATKKSECSTRSKLTTNLLEKISVATSKATCLLTQPSKDELMLLQAMGSGRQSRRSVGLAIDSFESETVFASASSPSSATRRTKASEFYKNKKKASNCLQRWLQSPIFELLMGITVSTHSIFVGVEIDYTVKHPGRTHFFFAIVSYFYTLVFLVELLLRLVAHGKDFILDFSSRELLWNYLDIALVLVSLAEVVVEFLFHSVSGGADVTSNMRIIRMVRVFRVLRVMRIVRLVRFLSPLRQLVFSILVTLKSVFWSMVLMATIIYVFAIIFTQAAAQYRTPEGPSEGAHINLYDRYWNTVATSMLTLLAAIAGGVSWLDAAELLQDMHVILMYIFLAYIGFTYFAVLNVVTGVFCQAAMVSTSEDQDSMMQTVLRHKQMYTERFMEIFQILDEDATGTITVQEFVARMGDDDVKNYFASLDLVCEDALCLFDLIDDLSADGIAVEEFVMGCLRLKGAARSSDMIRLLHENEKQMQQLYNILDALEKGSPATGSNSRNLHGIKAAVENTFSLKPVSSTG